jgi:hypothetical protein
LLPELTFVTRRWEANVAHVKVEVEVGIFDPIRMVEAEGHFDEPATKWRQQVEALADDAFDFVERKRCSGSGRVENSEAADMSVCRGRFHVEKAGVEAGELLQVRLLKRDWARRLFFGRASPPVI